MESWPFYGPDPQKSKCVGVPPTMLPPLCNTSPSDVVVANLHFDFRMSLKTFPLRRKIRIKTGYHLSYGQILPRYREHFWSLHTVRYQYCRFHLVSSAPPYTCHQPIKIYIKSSVRKINLKFEYSLKTRIIWGALQPTPGG